MANTTNIDLVKPAGTDHALVSVLNANSDKIDAEAGNVRSNFALVQNTNTATQAISKDQLVVWKGVLKKATSNIANGATLSNSNLTDTKVSTELASLSDQIVTSSAINIGATGHETSVKAWKTGNVAFVDFGGTYYGVSIPSGYVPKYTYNRMVALVGEYGTRAYYPAIVAYDSGTFKIYEEKNGNETDIPEDGTYNVYGTICYAL